MMRVLVGCAVMMMATQANAASADVQAWAYGCWSVPGTFSDAPPPLKFDIELDAKGGVKDITFVGDKPEDKQVADFILLTSRAIEQCAPYPESDAGTHRITMDVADFAKPAPEIDPFQK